MGWLPLTLLVTPEIFGCSDLCSAHQTELESMSLSQGMLWCEALVLVRQREDKNLLHPVAVSRSCSLHPPYPGLAKSHLQVLCIQLVMAATICVTLPAGLSSPGQTCLAPSGFGVAGTLPAVCDEQQRPAAKRGWDLQWCFYFRCSRSFLLENTPALPPQQGRKKKKIKKGCRNGSGTC